MKLEDFPYRTTFNSIIVKASVASEYDTHLALASVQNLRPYLPTVDFDKNPDLLAITFNAFVANKANRNEQLIDGEHSIKLAPLFVNKYINIEHERKEIVGFINGYGFSEFGTDKPLTLEEVTELSASNTPFNVCLSGFVWGLVNPDLVEKLEKSSDPTSNEYLSVSASWEMAFKSFNIVRGSKNINEGELITDPEIIQSLKGNLKVFGGKGIDFDGVPIYTNVVGETLLALGCGLVENPAAHVKGVATQSSNIDIKIKANEEEQNKLGIIEETTVIDHTEQLTQQVQTTMDIKDIKDLTDESLKTISASVIKQMFEDKIAEASESWSKKVTNKEGEISTLKEEVASIKTKVEELTSEKEALSSELNDFKIKASEKELEDKFQTRMGAINDKYELADNVVAIVVDKVKACITDEAFNSWYSEFEAYNVDNTKEAVAKRKEKEQTTTIQASVATPDVTDTVLNTPVEAPTLPNASDDVAAPSLLEKMKQAFSGDSISITH